MAVLNWPSGQRAWMPRHPSVCAEGANESLRGSPRVHCGWNPGWTISVQLGSSNKMPQTGCEVQSFLSTWLDLESPRWTGLGFFRKILTKKTYNIIKNGVLNMILPQLSWSLPGILSKQQKKVINDTSGNLWTEMYCSSIWRRWSPRSRCQ